MKIIQTKNTNNGFFGEIKNSLSVEAATAKWNKAFAYIRRFLDNTPKSAFREDWEEKDIRNFLDSKFGRHCATSELKGEPIELQIANRPARFLRNFSKIVRDRELFE